MDTVNSQAVAVSTKHEESMMSKRAYLIGAMVAAAVSTAGVAQSTGSAGTGTPVGPGAKAATATNGGTMDAPRNEAAKKTTKKAAKKPAPRATSTPRR